MEREKHIAYKDGWFSHKLGETKKNPYQQTAQPISHDLWDEGYCARLKIVSNLDESKKTIKQLDAEVKWS